MPELVLYGIRELALAIPRTTPRHRGGPHCDKGTVHIFALQDYRLNKRSALASIGVPGAYAGSQWSLASFTVPQECACICAFVGSGHIAAVCLDGSFHNYHFSADGIINQAKYDVITELCEDCDWTAMRHS